MIGSGRLIPERSGSGSATYVDCDPPPSSSAPLPALIMRRLAANPTARHSPHGAPTVRPLAARGFVAVRVTSLHEPAVSPSVVSAIASLTPAGRQSPSPHRVNISAAASANADEAALGHHLRRRQITSGASRLASPRRSALPLPRPSRPVFDPRTATRDAASSPALHPPPRVPRTGSLATGASRRSSGAAAQPKRRQRDGPLSHPLKSSIFNCNGKLPRLCAAAPGRFTDRLRKRSSL